jgi:hypothetical protein
MSPLPRLFRLPETRWVFWFFAVILAVLLFLKGPGYHSPRSFIAAWQLGHILAFSVWSYLLLTWNPVRVAFPAHQWGIVILFCLVAGGVTEGIQLLLGGDASLGDLLRDGVGGIITLSWFASPEKILSREFRLTLRGLSVSFLLVACLPLMVSMIDEGIALAQFPLLSDFETPFEKNRWKSDGFTSVDPSVVRHGKVSLRVDLNTSLYSGIGLVYFPRDWKGYSFLLLEVFNSSSKEFDIICRIHDRQHEEGEQRYEDRFNQGFLLRPGWNNLRIDLNDVANAPIGRKMDLRKIELVGLFAVRLPEPRTIFVDYVRLE